MEDALKRLDKATQEEARMATAEVLRTTRAVDQNVRRVGEQVLAVDNKMDSVGDRVASVDYKVAKIINGAQFINIPA
jgi:hypothetical protein